MIENFIKFYCSKEEYIENVKDLKICYETNPSIISLYEEFENYCKTDYYCANLQYVKDVDCEFSTIVLYNYNSKLEPLNDDLFNTYPKEMKINMMLQYILFFGHMAYEYNYYFHSNNMSVLDLDKNFYVLYKIGKTLYRLEVSKLLIFHPDNVEKTNFSEYLFRDQDEKNIIEFILFLGENGKTFLEKYIYSKEFSEIISYEKYKEKYGKYYTFKNYINMLFENDNIYQSNKDLRDFKYDKTLCKN
uniref:Uncharacterized protein n=1 Tax=Pithovirus LCDPAC02 TaxID=2506601 RepID=A0A481YQ91_9VIRU|nr:MAG: hypothetical protein LCDPAC02_03290 [Pithovirus LCDPAC02]